MINGVDETRTPDPLLANPRAKGKKFLVKIVYRFYEHRLFN